jgi:hypothetical protein
VTNDGFVCIPGNPGGGTPGRGAKLEVNPPAPSQCITFDAGTTGGSAGATRAGGGGGGGGWGKWKTGNEGNVSYSAGGGGAGGSRGGVGNAGGAGGAGGNANPTTFNCVSVCPGGSYPISVAPTGNVNVSWNPQ